MSNTVQLSISVLATEFSVSRDTMRRTLSEAGVEPSGTGARGHGTYRLRDAIRAFNGRRGLDEMNPHLRLAQARAIETEDRIKKSRGELVDSFDVEQAIGRVLKACVHGFDTAVDTIERDVGITAQQADRLERHFDQCREHLYEDLTHAKENHARTARRTTGKNRGNPNGTGNRPGGPAGVHAPGVRGGRDKTPS